jgi:hypothetical protein
MNDAAQTRFTAGDGHQPADLRPGQRLLGDHPIDRSQLVIEELDVPDPGVDRLALLKRQLEASQPLATPDPEQVRARRLLLQPPLQRRIDLVLGTSPGAHQLLPASQPPAQDPTALIRHPHSLELPLPQKARQRPRIELVRLRPRASDPRVIR